MLDNLFYIILPYAAITLAVVDHGAALSANEALLTPACRHSFSRAMSSSTAQSRGTSAFS